MPAKYPVDFILRGKDTGASRSMRRVGRTLKGLGRTAGRVGRSLTSLKMLGGAALGAMAGSAILGKINSVANRLDDIGKASRRIGVATDALQELHHAGELQGVTTEVLNKGLGTFIKRLGEAKADTGELTTFLKRSNPEFLDMIKGAQGSEEALDLAFKAMSNIKDESRRAALAIALFGRAGLDMTLLTENGVAALQAQRREARELGIVMGGDALKGAEKYNDALTRLKGGMKGAFSNFAVQFQRGALPVLGTLTEFLKNNRDGIAQFGVDAGKGFHSAFEWVIANKGAFASIGRGIQVVAAALWNAVGAISAALDGLQSVGRKLGGGIISVDDTLFRATGGHMGKASNETQVKMDNAHAIYQNLKTRFELGSSITPGQSSELAAMLRPSMAQAFGNGQKVELEVKVSVGDKRNDITASVIAATPYGGAVNAFIRGARADGLMQ